MTPGAWPSSLPGWRILHRRAIGSTNEEARALIEAGASGQTVIVADEQMAGRGRRGRGWESPPGNLYCSAILDIEPEAELGQLSLLIAVAIADGLLSLAPDLPVNVKWPNDILIRGRKAAGILLEIASSPRAGTRSLVVAGFGVNLALHPEGATSLSAEGAPALTPMIVLPAILTALGERLSTWRAEGFATIEGAWRARAAGLGEPITVRLPRETIEGRFEALEPGGTLRLRLAHGGVRRILSGDVFLTPGG